MVFTRVNTLIRVTSKLSLHWVSYFSALPDVARVFVLEWLPREVCVESVPVECQHFLECLCWLAVIAMKNAAQKVSYDYYHCSRYYYFSCKDMKTMLQ